MNDLSTSLNDSLSEDILDISANFAEVALDSILDEGLLREIPFLSTAASIYKIGSSIKERHYIKKLWFFVSQLNQGVVDEEKRQQIKKTIVENSKQRTKEIEYMLILIDRYVSEEKPAMLAKLYLAFLDRLLSWDEVSKYGEVIDRLLLGDYEEMQQCYWNDLEDTFVSDSLLRLIALGLVIAHNKEVYTNNTVGALTIPPSTTKDYELTEFGTTFLRCMLGELEYWKNLDTRKNKRG